MTPISTKHEFETFVVGNPSPALLCFHSPFNAYCRRTLASLDELDESPLSPFLRFYSVDIDAVLESRTWLGREVRGIPTVVVFRQGVEVASFVGEFSTRLWAKKLSDLPIQL